MPETAQPINGQLTIPAVKLSVSINSETATNKALKAVDLVCSALAKQEASAEYLRVLVGRMLVEVRDRNLYEDSHPSFEAYTLELADRHRLSRSTLRDSMMIVERLPMLKPETAEKISMTNLTLAARVSKGMTPREIAGLLRSAASSNILEFREKIEEAGLAPPRKLPGTARSAFRKVTIRIEVSRSVADQWQALVGDQNPAKVFRSLLLEVAQSKAA